MKKHFFTLFLTLTALLLQAQNPARSGKDHAVFFYVTTFQPGWESLPETATDAKAIGKELTDSYGFSVEYVPNPGKADIENKILELNRRSFGSKDQLLLYFSMHGHFIANADRGYLIPADGKTPPDDPLGKTWLSYDDLGAYLSLSPCKHILLSLDACYSGAFGDRWMSYPGSVEASASQECKTREENALFHESYQYFSSGSREKRTPAQSKFAGRWLKTLQEGREKKVLTTNELRYNFGTIENPKPEGGAFSKKNGGGDFIFLHKSACAAALPIDKSADKAAWNAAKTANTLEAYKKYRTDFPGGEFRPLADKRIAELDAAQNEEQAWQDAKKTNTAKSYDDFLRDYPDSDYKDVALFNRSQLDAKKGADAPAECLVEIKTEFGAMLVQLYNSTPQHRDNFIKLTEEGFFNDLLFHRVIEGFMVQGGDPTSRNANAGQALGIGGPSHTVPAEFLDSLVHIKGSLCAARTGDQVNPEKRSNGSQFYIVQGKPLSQSELEAMESRKGIHYSKAQRDAYMTLGGTPFLDRDYTIFGKVVQGLEVIDKIAAVETLPGDRPKKDIKMQIRVMK